MMMNSSALGAYVQYTLAESFIPELPGCYRGKVRENYDLRDGTRILIATDGSAPLTASWPRSRSRVWS